MKTSTQTKLCTIDGCTKALRARGLCVSHYNVTRPNRHPKVTVNCDACGTACVKPKRSTPRYAHAYCSMVCRDYARHGAPACELPSTHWARWYGRTSEWTPPPPRQRLFQVGHCSECGDGIIEPAGQVPSRYCGRTCSRRVAKRTRRAREHNAPGDFRFMQVIHQYAKQGNACAYCKRPASGLPDPEHVMPLSRGGRNDMSNVVASCRACNADKSDLTLEEWSLSRALRGLPPLDTKLDSPAYIHLMHTGALRPAWRDTMQPQAQQVPQGGALVPL